MFLMTLGCVFKPTPQMGLEASPSFHFGAIGT